MDKIVDHLFILEVMEGENFQETILISELTKTVQMWHRKKKTKQRKTGNKTTRPKFDFQRAKEYQKIEKKSRILKFKN
jgi:hypothetical protein